MRVCTMPKVVFMCKGSRGDVLPLLSVALSYQQEHRENVIIVFVCASSSLDSHMRATLQQESYHTLELCDLPEFDIHRSNAVQDEERVQVLKREAVVCLEASKGANLIVYNLFSLEGQFIANHLNIPCIAMSPHLQTRSVPAAFKRKLSDSYPQLFKRLENNTSGEEVGYAEVDHWMWRMFLDDYGSVCESLGLPILPFSLNPNGTLPPPTPLLYGISRAVISRQPCWPDSVSLCGYWCLPPHFYHLPNSEVTSLLQSLPTPPLYVGFGSMETYLLDTNWELLFTTLEEALKRHSMSALFQCQASGPVAQAYSRLQPKLQRIHVVKGVLCHSWLFPLCSAVLHHGGSGTVAAALLAGRPQIISPVMFDQNMWAEHLSWVGVAYQCPSPGRLSVAELSRALEFVMEEGVCARIRELRKPLMSEDGIKLAVKEIEKALNRKGYDGIT